MRPAYARLPADQGEAMPAHRATYGGLPTEYRDVVFQLVYFRAEPARIRPFVPEPLEPAEDGLCVAFSIQVPFSSSYGPFQEAGIQIKVRFDGGEGFFNSHLYLDNVAAICAGRERWGAPKEYATIDLARHANLYTARVVKEGAPVMQLSSDIAEPAQMDELIPIFPSYRLKLIPRADGPGAAIKQLVSAAPEDVTVHQLYRGNGTVHFGANANTDLRPFAPVEEVAAFYQVASYLETYGQIVYDYLQG